MLHLDFETRSPVPISHGAHKYAEGAEVICMGYAFDDEPVQLWTPDQPYPDRVDRYTKHGHKIVAMLFCARLP